MKDSVVFFGTGPVAAKSLNSVLEDFKVELVVTKAKPAHHKGSWPIEDLARNKNLKIVFANDKSEVDDVLSSADFSSQLGLMIDFGVIVSELAINKFRLGIINSHFSLLPKWRSADPITYAILNGDKETGVSLMKIVPKLDEGLLIAQEKMSLPNDVNSIDLTEQLINLSNDMLKKYLPNYINGKIQPYSQPNEPATYSRKLTKADGKIDWNKPAERIEREVRAFSGWPKSHTKIGQIDLIITKAQVIEKNGKQGDYEVIDDKLTIFTAKNALEIERLQPVGKKEMTTEEFLRGYRNKL